jgi:hypothetical protein
MSDRISEVPPRRSTVRRLFQGRFLVVSILFHVLLALVATYLVVQTFTPRKQTFTAAPPAPNPNREVEHKVQVAKKQQTMSAPSAKRIATTGLSNVALPAMPDISAADVPSAMQGLGATSGPTGMGGMQGSSGGGAGAGGVPLFGLRTSGAGLTGTFYDLKQTRSGHPSEFAIAGEYRSKEESVINSKYHGAVDKFVRANLSTSILSRYFVGPVELYATQIYIPWIQSDRAPEEFDLKGKVEPRRWLVVYQGNVVPPQDGDYTFVGQADDIIAVKFNNKIVLNNFAAKRKYDYSAAKFQQAAVGDTVHVHGGASYPITVVIGEFPGGRFGAYLMIQKEKVTYKKDKAGNPILPLFKFAAGREPKGDRTLPPIARDTSWNVWKAQSAAAPSSTGIGLLSR